jgi:hypothetical protein
MSIKKLISIKNAVQNTFEDIGIDITKDIPVFTRWAVAAEREIGSYYSYRKKISVLTIENCRAKLPCDAMAVQIVIGGDQGCDCGDLFSRCSVLSNNSVALTSISTFSNTNSFLVVDSTFGLNDLRFTSTGWDIQNDYLVFKSNLDGEKVTIQYLGLEVDCDGFPLICENHLEAITEYIMYKYCMRSRFSANKIDLGDAKLHFAEWNRLCSHSRAMDNEISESDKNEIAALLNNPLSGWGLTLGMNKPLGSYNSIW